MIVYRVLVAETDGSVVVVEYHTEQTVAEERAATYQQAGYRADVMRGQRANGDGDFTPEENA